MRKYFNTVTVTDVGLASALFYRNHRSINCHEDKLAGKLYCIFPSSKALRQDISRYNRGDFVVNASEFIDSLEGLMEHLEEYDMYLENGLNNERKELQAA